MSDLRVAPSVLKWAAVQAGRSVDDVARKVSKRDPARIISGELSEAQAIKFAKITSVPLGQLFLSEPPPDRAMPIADFRTIADAEPLGREFFETYDDVSLKQSWYRAYLVESGAEKVPFMGRFSGLTAKSAEVADDMRQTLGITHEEVQALPSAESLFSFLSAKAEAAGVLVFKNSVVGNNTSRPLSEKQFRGFALSDPYAPAVFVNGADAKAAWVFTLAHELAHIWLGESGVSDARHDARTEEERRCNRIAGAFLLPRAPFERFWHAFAGDDLDRINAARIHFRVSSLAIAIRAIELGLTPSSTYAALQKLMGGQRRTTSEGGNFYATLAVRNSRTLSARVAGLAVSGGMTFKEAGRLLNVNPSLVSTFHARLG